MNPGDKYNMLTVIGKTDKKPKKSYLWEFKCDYIQENRQFKEKQK